MAAKCAGFLSGELKIFDGCLPSEVNKKYKTLDGNWFHIYCTGATIFDENRKKQCCPLCYLEKRSGYYKKFASKVKVKCKRSRNGKVKVSN